MKRLVERELAPQSLEAEAARLLDSVGPHEPPPHMEQRVRAKILAAPVRRAPLVPRAAWAAVLLCASAAAAAGVLYGTRAPSTTPTVAPSRPAPHSRLDSAAVPVPPAPTASTPVVAEGPGTPVAVPNAPATAPAAPTPSHGAAKADELTEANLLFEATRALRREGDPARATRLLQQYSRQFPRGALGEEALALSIEAAEARGDGRAQVLAKRYLKLYPNGHFVDKAKRALERNAE